MSAAKRNTTVDLARLFASFGVIAIHVQNSTPGAQAITDFFWPLCVPFFYAVSLTYFVAGLKRATVYDIFAKAWARIAVPYLVWTAIYTGLMVAKHLLLGGSNTFVWWRIILYGESAVHLYFLPTLLLLQAFTLAVYLLATPALQQRGLGLAVLAGALAYLVWGDMHNCFGVAATGQIIAIVSYIGLAFYFAPRMQHLQFNGFYCGLGGLLLAVAVISNCLGYTYRVLEYPLVLPLGGIGLLLVTFGIPKSTMPSWLATLVSLSFGIYLCHVVFLETFEFVAKKIIPGGIYYTFAAKLLVVSMLFIVSAIFTFCARKLSLGRQFLLGEPA